MTESLQQRYGPETICFGCGPANPLGLRIQSIVEGDRVVADWTPASHHEAFPGVINGGIIGALIDCHSNWTAAHHLMSERGADIPPVTVTADFSVQLRRPTPSGVPLHIEAWVIGSDDPKVTVEATLEAGGKVCATGTATFVAVEEGHPAYHRW